VRHCLRTVNIVDLEIEVICLIDLEVSSLVVEQLGRADIGVFDIVPNGHVINAANANGAALFFDIAFKLSVAVRNSNVGLVKGIQEALAPNGRNKIKKRHRFLILSLL
jgi:hypothetical protein